MEEINLVFDTQNNSICIHLETPSKEDVLNYAEDLDSWDNLYISLKNGYVLTLRNYLLKLLRS